MATTTKTILINCSRQLINMFHNGTDPKPMQQRTQPSRSNKSSTAQPDCHSAIGQHLLKNRECAKNNEETKFSVLTIVCSHFQLQILEAMCIKIRQPFLCKQRVLFLLALTRAKLESGASHL